MASSRVTRVSICRLVGVPVGFGWESSPVVLFCKGCLLHVLIALKGDLGLKGRAVWLTGLNWFWKEKRSLNFSCLT